MMRPMHLEAPLVVGATEGSSDVFKDIFPIKNLLSLMHFVYLFISVVIDLYPHLLTDKITNRI